MSTDIPAEVMAGIRERAREEWPDDADMRNWTVKNEVDAFRTIADLDFGPAAAFRDGILKEAEEYGESWEMRAGFVTEEVDAFAALAVMTPDDVPAAMLDGWKRDAAAEHDWFQHQLEDVERHVARHRYIERTRATVEPIRDLLTAMERIIGSECYNGNIQNYGAGGVWEGEGRSFRYPASFVIGDRVQKRPGGTDEIAPEELITGHYRFGANELGIYRALVRVVEMLERDYGFVVPFRGVTT